LNHGYPPSRISLKSIEINTIIITLSNTGIIRNEKILSEYRLNYWYFNQRAKRGALKPRSIPILKNVIYRNINILKYNI